jgi:hypothetical protein
VPNHPFALARICRFPPSTSIRFSLLSAKNAIERLLGDQNGNEAPSVPPTTAAEPVSKERSHSAGRPSEGATKTICLPSGEIARDILSVVEGVVISKLISGAAGTGRSA